MRGNLLVIQIGQYRAREQVRSRRIGNSVEGGLSNWVLHDSSVRGSVFDPNAPDVTGKGGGGERVASPWP